MNNETLEVEDLAEKITQAQLEEVKAHFDTKLSATKTEVISEVAQMIKDAKDEIIQSNNDSKDKKNSTIKFVVGSIIVPLLVVLITIWATLELQPIS